jgi:hypothetical protein
MLQIYVQRQWLYCQCIESISDSLSENGQGQCRLELTAITLAHKGICMSSCIEFNSWEFVHIAEVGLRIQQLYHIDIEIWSFI